jgi:glycosyltransferase involved in cell wall biosynthesis
MKRPGTPLSIGFDAKRVYENRRGLGSYSRTLLRGLLKYGHEVSCRLYAPRKTPLFDETKAQVITPKHGSLLWRQLSSGHQAVKDGCAIFHGLSNELPALPSGRIKAIVTIHDLLFLRFPKRYKPWDRLMYLLKTRSAIRRADRIIAISRQTAEDLERSFGLPKRKICVLPPACGEQYFTPPSASEMQRTLGRLGLSRGFLLYTGAVTPSKNLGLLIESLGRLSPSAPILVIAGAGQPAYRKKLDDLAKKSGAGVRVRFTMDSGPLTDDELRCLYRLASALIFPSYFEGFGLPVVEAMASGTPVLCSRTGGLEEAAAGAALLFDPDDPENLARQISRVLKDKNLRLALIRKGKIRSARLHPRIITRRLVSIYRELAGVPS